MSEYGNGVSMQRAFMYDKERIKKAFEGQTVCGENEEGFEYTPASREECMSEILSAFDNAVYQALKANCSAKALEKLGKKAGIEFPLSDYMAAMAKEEAIVLEKGEYEFEIK